MREVLNYSSILYAILLFLGYSFLDIYYDTAGIDIYPYLDASEVLLSFLKNANSIFIAVFLLILIPLFLGVLLPKSIFKTKVDGDSQLNSSEKIKKLKKELWFNYIMIIVNILFVINAVWTLIKDWSEHSDAKMLILICVFSLFVIFLFYKRIHKVDNDSNASWKIEIKVLFIVWSAFVFNAFMARTAYHYSIKSSAVEVSFCYHGKQIITGKKLIFIGETNKYLFIRDTIKNSNLIYEKENIDHVEMKSKSRFFRGI